jgi:hypothetical protein
MPYKSLKSFGDPGRIEAATFSLEGSQRRSGTFLTGFIARRYGLRPQPFYLGTLVSLSALSCLAG